MAGGFLGLLASGAAWAADPVTLTFDWPDELHGTMDVELSLRKVLPEGETEVRARVTCSLSARRAEATHELHRRCRIRRLDADGDEAYARPVVENLRWLERPAAFTVGPDGRWLSGGLEGVHGVTPEQEWQAAEGQRLFWEPLVEWWSGLVVAPDGEARGEVAGLLSAGRKPAVIATRAGVSCGRRGPTRGCFALEVGPEVGDETQTVRLEPGTLVPWRYEGSSRRSTATATAASTDEVDLRIRMRWESRTPEP